MPAITQPIFALILIVLLPTLPAYLLFRLLPASAFVEGPFKGLKINLSGSFAGYFLLFLALIGTIKIWIEVNPISYERWTVMGRINTEDGSASPYIDPRYVTFSTPSLRSDPNGNFSVTFLRTTDGLIDYPELYINFPGYAPQTFYLGPKEKNFRGDKLPIHIDKNTFQIELGAVTLVKIPPSVSTVSTDTQGNSVVLTSNPYAFKQ